VETNAANAVNICNTRHRIPVRPPENSTTYFALLIATVQMLFTFLRFRLWPPMRWRVWYGYIPLILTLGYVHELSIRRLLFVYSTEG
jgi:hypothetical protein